MILNETELKELSAVVKRSSRISLTLEELTELEKQKLNVLSHSTFRNDNRTLDYVNKLSKKYDTNQFLVVDALLAAYTWLFSRSEFYRNIKLTRETLAFLRKASHIIAAPLYRGLSEYNGTGLYKDNQFSSWSYSLDAAALFTSGSSGKILKLDYREYSSNVAWSFVGSDLRIFSVSKGFYSEKEVILKPGTYNASIVSNRINMSSGSLFDIIRDLFRVSPNLYKSVDDHTRAFYNELKKNPTRYSNYKEIQKLMKRLDLWASYEDKEASRWESFMRNVKP